MTQFLDLVPLSPFFHSWSVCPECSTHDWTSASWPPLSFAAVTADCGVGWLHAPRTRATARRVCHLQVVFLMDCLKLQLGLKKAVIDAIGSVITHIFHKEFLLSVTAFETCVPLSDQSWLRSLPPLHAAIVSPTATTPPPPPPALLYGDSVKK